MDFFHYLIFTLQKSVSIVEYTYIMSISRQNLSVIIVNYKSEHVIHRCINSIDEEIIKPNREKIITDFDENLSFA